MPKVKTGKAVICFKRSGMADSSVGGYDFRGRAQSRRGIYFRENGKLFSRMASGLGCIAKGGKHRRVRVGFWHNVALVDGTDCPVFAATREPENNSFHEPISQEPRGARSGRLQASTLFLEQENTLCTILWWRRHWH
jgi:hypothetical protein